ADVRFLDNPHWIPELRALTGTDAPVRDHVLAAEGAQDFVESLVTMLENALRHYRAHDKHNVTVAIGCTGGRHRSVAIAEAVASRIGALGFPTRVSHRDKDGRS